MLQKAFHAKYRGEKPAYADVIRKGSVEDEGRKKNRNTALVSHLVIVDEVEVLKR